MRPAVTDIARFVWRVAGSARHDAQRQVRADLRADPYLPYILLVSALLSGFWLWHRLPNFATRDERWRVVDPIEAFAALHREVSYGALREGVTYWRSYGATFYLSGLLVVPALVLAVAVGQLDVFAAMGHHLDASPWTHWLRTPGWLWTASVLAVRVANVGFAVGSVYLVYRTGTHLRDRATGRLAAILLAVTWGVLVLAHEAGEDVPALFGFLLSFYLALRYVERGTVREFYAASLAGGVAAGLKLTAGVSAVVVGWAFVLRARREDGPIRARLWRPGLLATGAGLGVAAIICSYPSVLVGDPAALGGRLLRSAAGKSTPHGWRVEPSWWWILRGYLQGLGLALTVAAGSAVVASLSVFRERSTEGTGIQLALIATGVLLAGYSRWAYVRTHHLLLTFPLLVLVVAVMAKRLRERQQLVARAFVALLLITSGVYAVGGDLAYAAQPRDAAADWLADRNGTVETYVRDPQEAPLPHDAPVSHSNNRTVVVGNDTYEPGLRRWTLAMPERCPEYVVLTHHRALLYLAPEEWGKRAEQLSDPVVQRYVSALLAEDTYPYEVAATFGRRPRYLDGEGQRSTSEEMARVGVRPRTIQYGDPQDFGIDQYTVILARTGACDPAENSPFRSSA